MAEADAIRLSASAWFRGERRRERRKCTLADSDITAYTQAQVAFARRAWPMKAAQELRSAAVFSELQRCALLLGLPLDVVMAFSRAAQDELSHAEVCTMVGERLGAAGPRLEMRGVETRFAAHPDTQRRFLALLLAETAVGETVSCALFRAAVRSSREPLTRSALSLILADEALHARLGWKALGWVLQTRDLVDAPFLRDELRRHFQWIEQGTRGSRPPPAGGKGIVQSGIG